MMSADDRRNRLLLAIAGPTGADDLRTVVVALRAEGVSRKTLVDDLASLHPLLSDPDEDRVLDVMDCLTGWCAPALRID